RRRHTRFSRDWSSDVCSSDWARHPAALKKKGETYYLCARGGANKKSCAARSGQAKRIEEALVLGDGKAVGHAGDVVGHRPGAAGRALLGFERRQPRLLLGRQQQRVGEERLEQRGDDALGLAHHAVDAVVAVEVAEQETLEAAQLAPYRVAEADQRLRVPAHLIDIGDLGVLDGPMAGLDQVGDQVIDEVAYHLVSQPPFRQ